MRSNLRGSAVDFSSRLQGELLARLLLGPERESSMLDLAVMLRTDLGTVVREVERLARAEVLVLRHTDTGRLVSRNAATPLYEPLVRLLMLTFGPSAVVAEEFGKLPGAEEVHLFGAWADRYAQVPGPPPGDVEVLVIGYVEREPAFDAAQEATARLGLPVHPVVRTPAQWANDDDPFLREIRAVGLVRVLPGY
jgi:hypothetical protein